MTLLVDILGWLFAGGAALAFIACVLVGLMDCIADREIAREKRDREP